MGKSHSFHQITDTASLTGSGFQKFFPGRCVKKQVVYQKGRSFRCADLFQALMVVINIPVILILGRTAIKALKDYTEQRKAGKNPEFKAANIGLKEKTDYWN